jgi:glycerol-3-phosphate acyltransferase PlsY
MNALIAGIGWLLVTYLIGSIPFGLIVAKGCKGIDPRLWGSHNTGATNVARTCGTGYGLLTFGLDVLKGLAPMLLAMGWSTSAAFLTLTGLAALLGHMYSIFLNRKGGKGVATTIGLFIAVTPSPLFWALVLCLAMIAVTKYVSLGSLTLVATLPIFILIFGQFSYLIFSLIVMVLVFSKHQDNILRVIRGEENPWKRSSFESEVG